jgi:hypothetical protein
MQMIIPAMDPTNIFSSLKHLEMKMDMSSRKHGLLCLVSFLDAAPFLEKFIVHVSSLFHRFNILNRECWKEENC